MQLSLESSLQYCKKKILFGFVHAWCRVGCSTTSLSLTSLRCVRYQDSIFPLFSLSSCEPGFSISGSKGPGRGLSKHLEKKEWRRYRAKKCSSQAQSLLSRDGVRKASQVKYIDRFVWNLTCGLSQIRFNEIDLKQCVYLPSFRM